jgi:putative nucleotidyltransferase with HDIG domain
LLINIQQRAGIKITTIRSERKVKLTLELHNETLIVDDLKFKWSYKKENLDSLKVVQALFNCLKIRDPFTAAHSVHMAEYSYRLAEQFDKENARLYFIGSLIHDIGKVGMSDKVLKGREILTPEERIYLREHVLDGYRLLRDLSLPEVILDIVRYHHERYNGIGYVEGLQGTSIPLPGRIAAITDTYSALTSERSYSKSMEHSKAIEIMKRDSEQYDPQILSYFINHFNDKKTNIMGSIANLNLNTREV